MYDHPNYPPKSQPIDYVKLPHPPTLILAPEKDTLVSVERNSEALHQALQAAGNTSTFQSIEGTDHVTLVGTLSPLLFFKGSTAKPINQFIKTLHETKQTAKATTP